MKTIRTVAGHTFHEAGYSGAITTLFSVAPGVPLLDALQEASNLLSTTQDLIHAAAMCQTPLEGNEAWLVNHTLASVKAVIDSLVEAAEDAAR